MCLGWCLAGAWDLLCGLWFGEGEAEYSSSDRKLVFHVHSAVRGSTRIPSPRMWWEGLPSGITYTSIFDPTYRFPASLMTNFYMIFSPLIVWLAINNFVWVLFPFCSFPVLQFLSRLLSNRCLLVPPHFGWVVLCPTTAEPCGTSSTCTWGSALGLSHSDNQPYSISVRSEIKRKVKNPKAFLA